MLQKYALKIAQKSQKFTPQMNPYREHMIGLLRFLSKINCSMQAFKVSPLPYMAMESSQKCFICYLFTWYANQHWFRGGQWMEETSVMKVWLTICMEKQENLNSSLSSCFGKDCWFFLSTIMPSRAFPPETFALVIAQACISLFGFFEVIFLH